MASNIHTPFPNYYEYLNVPQNASREVIENALKSLVITTQARLGNPLTMDMARQMMNEILPAIYHYLLADERVRAEYDRQLVASQQRAAYHDELPDNEGLDEILRLPFFFDPYEGYDVETPAFSLRQVAQKLDTEWQRARGWITDTSDDVHVFVGFLTDVAGRQRLAQRIEEEIIKAVSPARNIHMDVNEGIERCINILDPRIERPAVHIYNASFDGKVLWAGEFISDQPARVDLVLGHSGIRGCTFGTIKSQTDWLVFQDGQPDVHFHLMPEGTDPQIGPSEVTISLFFQLSRLERNAEHVAQLLLHVENHDPTLVVPILVKILVLPLPPRVRFEPVATADAPLWAGATLRGETAKAIIVPRNMGDEHLVPLAAHISTNEPGASAEPALFHADKPVTFSIDTTHRPVGKQFEVAFQVDYRATSGAMGPTSLHVRGEVLPTAWQSLLREESGSSRLGIGLLVGLAGLVLSGVIGVGLSNRAGIAGLFCLAVPVMYIIAIRLIAATLVEHIQRSGHKMSMQAVPAWMLWWLPLGLGALQALLCLFISNSGVAFWLGAIVGGIVGATSGFIVDKTGLKKARTPQRGEQ